MRRMLAGLFALFLAVAPVAAQDVAESELLAEAVKSGELPPMLERVPVQPLFVDLEAEGKSLGQYGGSLNMIMGRAKDTRLMVVYGYARLVGYEAGSFELKPDLAKDVIVTENRIFEFVLREGHRWSDGQPFTSEDIRYWWEDVANDEDLSPTGPPSSLLVEGEAPVVEVLSPTRVRFSWSRPNPEFLPSIAGARPLYIYRPAHYLKQFHKKYASEEELAGWIEAYHLQSWAAVHNKLDNLYKQDNPDLPTLQPWRLVTAPPSDRFVFQRNPYYHKVDKAGRQLPYIDEVIFQIASSGLIPAKTGAGEADLQARYLNFDGYTFLRRSEERSDFETYLWKTAKGAHVALYPNMNVEDPVWRELMRDVRFRRALSLAVNRKEVNQVNYFGLAIEGNNTMLPSSPLFKPEYRSRWAEVNLREANRLLDEIGLIERDSRGIRLLPDGRPAEIIVESAGESTEDADVLELVHDSWMEAGIKIFTRPSQRTVFRNRIFAGQTQMAIWFGLENGIATAATSPEELAPTAQTQYMWPKWGQFYQTGGKAGEAPDMEVPKRLLNMLGEWRRATDNATRKKIWHQMLELWTDEVYSIGIVGGVLQPIVVDLKLYNVPVEGIFNWDPGAQFGLYRPDSFYFGEKRERTPEDLLTAAARGRS